MGFLVALFVCLLPEEWRGRWRHVPLKAAGYVTASIEIVAGFVLFVFGNYLYERETGSHFFGGSSDATGSVNAGGAVSFFLFAFSPRGILTFGMLVEGAVRYATTVTGEPSGTFPVWLAARLRQALGFARRRRELAKAAEIADDVSVTADLVSISSASRFEWDDLTTVEVEGQLYRVALREERDGGERPHVVRLERIPESWIVRRLVRYR